MSFGGQYGGIASGGVGQGLNQAGQSVLEAVKYKDARDRQEKQQNIENNRAQYDRIAAQRAYLLDRPIQYTGDETPEELAAKGKQEDERATSIENMSTMLAGLFPRSFDPEQLPAEFKNKDGTPRSWEEIFKTPDSSLAGKLSGEKGAARKTYAELTAQYAVLSQQRQAAFDAGGADSDTFKDLDTKTKDLYGQLQAAYKKGYGRDLIAGSPMDIAGLEKDSPARVVGKNIVASLTTFASNSTDPVAKLVLQAVSQNPKGVTPATTLADLGINVPGVDTSLKLGDYLRQSGVADQVNALVLSSDPNARVQAAQLMQFMTPEDRAKLNLTAQKVFDAMTVTDENDPNFMPDVAKWRSDAGVSVYALRTARYGLNKSTATDAASYAAAGNSGYQALIPDYRATLKSQGMSDEDIDKKVGELKDSYDSAVQNRAIDYQIKVNAVKSGKVQLAQGMADLINSGSLYAADKGSGDTPDFSGIAWEAYKEQYPNDDNLARQVYLRDWKSSKGRWDKLDAKAQADLDLTQANVGIAQTQNLIGSKTYQATIKKILNDTKLSDNSVTVSDAEVENLPFKSAADRYAFLNQLAVNGGEKALQQPAVQNLIKKYGLDPSAAAATAKFTEWQRKNAIEQADYDKLAKLLANPSITLASSKELTALAKKMGIDGNFLLSEAKRLRTQGIKMDAATLEQMQVSVWATRNGVQINWANYWAGRQDSARDYARGVFVSDRAYNWGVTTFNQTFARDNFVKDRDYALNQANSIISAVNAGRQVDAAVLQSLTVASTDLNTSIGQTASMIDQDSKDIAALEASTPLLKSADGNRPYTVDPKTGVYSVKPNINDPQVAQYVRLQNDKLARTQTVNELLATKDTLRTQISGAISQATASSSNTDFTPLFQSLGIDRSLLPGNQGTPPPSSGGTVTVPKNLTDAYSVLSGGAKVKVTQQAGATTTDPKGHAGSDLVILGANGSPVKGASIKNPFAGATVLEVGAWDGKNDPKAKNFGSNTYGYGNYVKLALPGGYTAIVAHMDAPSTLKSGQALSQGDLLGLQGKTGNATGYHVHLEVRDPSGKAIRDAATLQSLFGPGSALFPKAGAAPTTPTSAPSGTEFSFSYKPIAGARRNLTQVGPADAFYVQTPQGYDVYTPQQGRALVSQINMAMKKNLAGYLGRSVGERKEALKMYLGALGVGGFAVDTIVDDFFKPAK